MPTRSFSEQPAAAVIDTSLPALNWSIDWPIERVAMDVEVVVIRRLNILEWALLRVANDIVPMPSVEEAAVELGLEDPVLLRETLEKVVAMGLLESRDAAVAGDLTRCRITDAGRAAMSSSQPAPLPERHGFLAYFDGVTGEAVAADPRSLSERAFRPLVAPDKISSRRETVGLDRLRQLVKDEPWNCDGARITGADVIADKSERLWQRTSIHIRIDAETGFQVDIPEALPARRDWIHNGGGRAVKAQWGRVLPRWIKGSLHVPEVGVRSRFGELIAPDRWKVRTEALIAEAQSEIVLHAGWMNARDMDLLLRQAAARGVRCFVCGSAPKLSAWNNGSPRPPGFVAAGADPSVERPLALVADDRAICFEHICMPGDRRERIDFVATLQPDAVESTRSALLRGFELDFPQDDERGLFVAFGATRDAVYWRSGQQFLMTERDGLERIDALRHWGLWGEALTGNEMGDGDWLGSATEAWWAAFDSIAGNGAIDALLKRAVDLVQPAEALAAMADRIASTSVLVDEAPMVALIRDAVAVRKLWPRFDPMKSCHRWFSGLRRCLAIGERLQLPAAIERAHAALSTDKELNASRNFWASAISVALTEPDDLASLVAWLQAHVPLATDLRQRIERDATTYLKRINVSSGADPALIRELRAVWNDLGLSSAALRRISGTETSNTTATRSAKS
ncbi:MAG: hypothetical protein H6819_02295 [Phycisphaerales bacterium]|nr:hypothetical protein [Phycisphaerales bacterium]MCB9856957.1 hypothetical protein [Phycisphaerales bacterium]MCB9861916.1 hypothetical protein [Phycisphaerales bacterium]